MASNEAIGTGHEHGCLVIHVGTQTRNAGGGQMLAGALPNDDMSLDHFHPECTAWRCGTTGISVGDELIFHRMAMVVTSFSQIKKLRQSTACKFGVFYGYRPDVR
jgi:hypothetical protein